MATASTGDAGHGRYIAVETLIGAAINLAIGLIAGLIAAGGRASEPLLGGGGMLVDMVPETFMVAFMSVLIPTLLTRNRRRKGRVRAMAGGGRSRHPLLRAAAAGLAATIVAMPILYLLLGAMPRAEWATGPVLLFKAVYAVLLSLAVTPPALRAALREPLA